MANKNNKKDGKVTAGDLFNKLKTKKGEPVEDSQEDELVFSEETADEKRSANGFSIDVSAEAESDSDLDINELLKKYMPEYEDSSAEDSAEDLKDGGGVLSKLKRSADEYSEEMPYGVDDGFSDEEDDSLISALDSVFGPESDDGDYAYADEVAEEISEEYAEPEEVGYEEEPTAGRRKKKKEKKPFFLFGFGKKKKEEELFEEDSYEEDPILSENAEELPEDAPVEEAGFEAFSADMPVEEDEYASFSIPQEDVKSQTTETRLGDLAELETMLNDPQPFNKSTPETRKAMAEAAVAREEKAEPAVEAEEVMLFDSFAEEAGLTETDVHAEKSEADAFAAEEEAPFEEDVDPTDLNLRVAFGLDEEEQQRTNTAAKQLGDRLEAKQFRREKRAKIDRPEFVDKTQIPKIRKEYHQKTMGLWIKLGLAVLFTLVLMWFENIAFFTDLFTGEAQQFAGAFDPAIYPVVYIMTSLQLMLLACLSAYEQIIDGFKYLFRGIPKAETLLAVLFTTGVIYSAVLARLIETPNEPVMFNFVVAFAAVLTLIYALYNTKRERMNFEVVSSKKAKHIVRRLPDEESMCEAKAFMEETDACDVMKIEKTDFIDGFFGRMYQPDTTVTVFMTCMMSIALALAVLVGFFVSLKGGDGADILRGAYMTLLVSAPVAILVSFSYPFYRATLAANEYDSAIIGETSLGEYSNASIISFDDKNVFPSYSVKIQNIKIYNNARVDRVLYYAASVFAHAGGPLQDVFEVATLEMGHSEDVEIFDTEAGFLATQVNGVNIIFGSYNKLTEKGFVIPKENASDDVDFSTESSIMYMFREDKLVAKMYIKYVMDGDIDLILKQFQGTGLYVCVRTFDPNIDERMIAKKLNMRRIPLRVVRYASKEEVTKYEEKVDSGLVTSASPKSLLQVISYCDKVLQTRRANIALSILSAFIGIAVIALLLLSNTLGAVNSLFVVLYHLLWVATAVLSAKVFIR